MASSHASYNFISLIMRSLFWSHSWNVSKCIFASFKHLTEQLETCQWFFVRAIWVCSVDLLDTGHDLSLEALNLWSFPLRHDGPDYGVLPLPSDHCVPHHHTCPAQTEPDSLSDPLEHVVSVWLITLLNPCDQKTILYTNGFASHKVLQVKNVFGALSVSPREMFDVWLLILSSQALLADDSLGCVDSAHHCQVLLHQENSRHPRLKTTGTFLYSSSFIFRGALLFAASKCFIPW